MTCLQVPRNEVERFEWGLARASSAGIWGYWVPGHDAIFVIYYRLTEGPRPPWNLAG